ncbi:MAG: hypothetical protein AMXMBFR64_32500 [Myxococcales bacterium]
MVVIKKYSNRRLYDTDESRYVTLEELAVKIERGADVVVTDAKTGEDLTQVTLTQILFESRGAAKLLPTPLLVQMIRMGDLPFAEFMGRWVSWAFEVYMQARRGIGLFTHLNPFASQPIPMPFGRPAPRSRPSAPVEPPDDEPPPDPDARDDRTASRDEVAALRKELDELKQLLLRRQ